MIEIRNKLIVHDTDPCYEAVSEYCKEHLVLDNPDYIKKKRMGLYVDNVDHKICLYESLPHSIALPFGCLQDVWDMCPRKEAYLYEICPVERLEYKSGINLYPYQEEAVQAALKWKNGALVMPCGSGKTQCGLEIIARIGGRALWLTHTHDLLAQSRDRAEACMDLPDGAIGTITAGKVNIGTHITFATVQTMAKLDLSQYRDMFNVVIVDEAQHCCGSPTRVTQFYKVVSHIAARYKIGLTATPKRADGLQAAMFALLGHKIHEVTRVQVAHNTCPIKVQTIETGYQPEYDAILQGDGTIDYNKLIDNMIGDDVRFEKIMSVINAIPHANPTIVLANRVKYLEDMRINYEKTGICLSSKYPSKEERKQALAALNNGEIDCIFATYQLAAEGLDVPNLRYVVFSTPEQNETTVIQAAGRVGRKADGKDFGTVIDFVDDFPMYRKWYSKRLRHYRELGAEVLP